MVTLDMSSDLIKEIRNKLAELMKQADETVVLIESKIKERENELDEKIREYAILKEREKKLNDYQNNLKKQETLVNLQKEANREKQIALEKKERELESTLQRVKGLLS